MINKPELLAPAGDMERLKVALLYGADAVYIGGPAFGLRANAINFTFEEIEEAVVFAHSLNKKVYVTVNIILHNREAEELVEYLKKLESAAVDAIIVSDPYVIKLANKYTKLPIFLSTQQSTINYEAAKFFYEQGIDRIILGRECSKEEIKEIIENIPVEIETFIHGAMCSGYSGRCVLSNYLTNRDANRGGCSQVCRWDFDLTDDKGNILAGEKDFTLSSKDLSLIEYLPEMIDMGIVSFKIEGRMRSVYYIATVVSIYRNAIDRYCSAPSNYKLENSDIEVLNNCANRDSVPQFFNGIYDETCSYYNGREETSNQDFLGIVLSYDEKEQLATIEQRNYFKVGDVVEIFSPKRETTTYKFSKIYDEENLEVEAVNHPKQVIRVPLDIKVERYDMIRVKK